MKTYRRIAPVDNNKNEIYKIDATDLHYSELSEIQDSYCQFDIYI